MSSPFIELQGLSKHYRLHGRTIPVLSGLNLEIAKGQACSITGKSGIGKSTFLHLVGTLDLPSAGTLRFDGEDVFSLDESKLAAFRNHTVGFVFQFHYLLREFTALENVMMPALVDRRGPAAARTLALGILDRVGLSHRLEHKPGELSGGEQQRVALARALVLEPRLLLADEPTGNLDEGTSAGIHQLLMDINESLGTTVVVVTHNPGLAAQMPRRLVLAEGGIREVA